MLLSTRKYILILLLELIILIVIINIINTALWAISEDRSTGKKLILLSG